MMKRRLMLAAAAAVVAAPAGARSTGRVLRVWRDPGCGCCGGWVEHMRAAGFRVEDNLVPSPAPAQRMLGTPPDLLACHAAAVDGYALEGHVPASAVLRLLTDRPAGIRGVAVPGMPPGSPGMEAPGQPEDTYDVIAFGRRAPQDVHALPRRTRGLSRPAAAEALGRGGIRQSVAGPIPWPPACCDGVVRHDHGTPGQLGFGRWADPPAGTCFEHKETTMTRLTTSLAALLAAGLAAGALQQQSGPAAPSGRATAGSQGMQGQGMSGMQGHSIAGMDHQAMMAHCAQMRQQVQQGGRLSPEMQQTMAHCDQMDRSMGSQRPR